VCRRKRDEVHVEVKIQEMLLIIPMNRTPDQRCFLCHYALKNKGAFFVLEELFSETGSTCFHFLCFSCFCFLSFCFQNK
jgi:hypothetical protein